MPVCAGVREYIYMHDIAPDPIASKALQNISKPWTLKRGSRTSRNTPTRKAPDIPLTDGERGCVQIPQQNTQQQHSTYVVTCTIDHTRRRRQHSFAARFSIISFFISHLTLQLQTNEFKNKQTHNEHTYRHTTAPAHDHTIHLQNYNHSSSSSSNS